ncbi:MAG: archaemetzincin family Zn-dependent metalloprotease [Candidatus Helarchaeota archaeon]|nr:archaemetzincin family Zn-dependent metalloprotease [Candidatus Helarchaeota archaeon]
MSKTLGIILIGDVDQTIGKFLQQNLLNCFDIFQKVLIFEKTEKIPKEAYNKVRGQYLSTPFLNLVKKRAEKEKYFKAIGVTEVDLYVPSLNFVFGVAISRACMISIHRLNPKFWGVGGLTNQNLFLERTLKESIHELGHTLGLSHCENYCIMRFSNTIMDTDDKPKEFCSNCSKKLLKIHK